MNKTCLIILVPLLLPACALKSERPDYGASTWHNQLNQTVDVLAGKRDVTADTMDGRKAATAIENYYNEKPEVETVRLIKDVGG